MQADCDTDCDTGVYRFQIDRDTDFFTRAREALVLAATQLPVKEVYLINMNLTKMLKRTIAVIRQLNSARVLNRCCEARPARLLMPVHAFVLTAVLTTALTTLLAAPALAATDNSNAGSSANVPTIAVSIKPLHSLVAAVTHGVSEPMLLFDGFSSPHTATLKPSMLRRLHSADVLVWVGTGIEVYLARVVADLNTDTQVVSFGQVDGVRHLPFRFDQHHHAHDEHTGTEDQEGADEEHHEHSQATPEPESIDYHFWLDPHNARQLVIHLSASLADIDPANAQIYESNARQMLDRLNQLDQQLNDLLANLSDVPYLVFHDSFQYLEQRYGLRRAMVIAEQPEIQPGARRLKTILRQVQEKNVKCLFAEPQFPAKVVSMLQRDSSVEVATLDPLASRYDAGPDLYATWLLELGQTLHDCLAG